jgi:hypothetical protein
LDEILPGILKKRIHGGFHPRIVPEPGKQSGRIILHQFPFLDCGKITRRLNDEGPFDENGKGYNDGGSPKKSPTGSERFENRLLLRIKY